MESKHLERMRAKMAEEGIADFYCRDISNVRWLTGFENVFDDEPAAYEQPERVQYILPKKKKVGLFTALAAFAAGSALAGRGKKKHDGHCDGDCANCPPHYGYRYGRWYYGKGHQYGCEFGGNKGDGSL